jgi:hypothetical protein
MEEKLVLKRKIKSKKFNITFPSNTPLNSKVMEGEYYVEHPEHKNVFTRVGEKNIKKGFQLKLF